MIKELSARAVVLMNSGNTKDSAAKKISAEFHAAAYVSKGKLWASFKDDEGKQQTRVLY